MSFTHPDCLHAAFAAAFQAGDVAALVDLYEDSAIQVQQDGTVTGRDELADVFARLLASGMTMQGDPQKAVIAGDLRPDVHPLHVRRRRVRRRTHGRHRRGVPPSGRRKLASRHRRADLRLSTQPRRRGQRPPPPRPAPPAALSRFAFASCSGRRVDK